MITGRPLISASSLDEAGGRPRRRREPFVIWMNPSLRSASTSASTRAGLVVHDVGHHRRAVEVALDARPGVGGGSRCADQPQAPASIASCSSRRISACSASVGSTPALARSQPEHPDEQRRRPARTGSMFTALGRARRRCRGTRGTSPSPTACPPASRRSGIASMRVIDSIDRSRSLGAHRREAEAAVADHDRRDAVPARQRAVRIPEQLRVVVRVQVDEAGRDDQAVGVEHAVRVAPGRSGRSAAIAAVADRRRRSDGAASRCRRPPCRRG